MSDVLKQFFDGQSEEEIKAGQEHLDKASAEGRAPELKISGRYLMEVSTFAYRDRDGNIRSTPEIWASSKNALMLGLNLKVVDGTDTVPKGSSKFTNICLSAAKGASNDTMEKLASVMKPQIAALTGEKDVRHSAAWIDEYLNPTFKMDEDGKIIMPAELIKDHKMKQKVMVVIEDELYNNKPVTSVKMISKAMPGEKSVSNKIIEEEPAQENPVQEGAPTTSPEDYNDIKPEVNDESSSDDSASVVNEGEIADIPDVPTMTEDN